MTRIRINKIKWNDWNIEHIKKHGVTIEEVAEAGRNLVFHRRTKKNRYLAVGKSGDRLITLIINKEGVGKYYLVTAFDTARKDKKKVYAKNK